MRHRRKRQIVFNNIRLVYSIGLIDFWRESFPLPVLISSYFICRSVPVKPTRSERPSAAQERANHGRHRSRSLPASQQGRAAIAVAAAVIPPPLPPTAQPQPTGFSIGNASDCRSVADPDPGSEIRDPVLFYPLDPGSGSGMNFLRIPDPRGMFFGEILLRILVL
jgi:hypothetical protein